MGGEQISDHDAGCLRGDDDRGGTVGGGRKGGEREREFKYDFDTVSANLPLLLWTRPGMTALAFGLFLMGFGIKMGRAVWAVLAAGRGSGGAVAGERDAVGRDDQDGVYGVMRYFLWLVPVSARESYPLARWGMLVAIWARSLYSRERCRR